MTLRFFVIDIVRKVCIAEGFMREEAERDISSKEEFFQGRRWEKHLFFKT